MLPIFTTEQVRDGIDSGDLLIDLSDYIKKKDAATKTDIESLTAVIAGKLDATPQHKHDISNVKDLQEELDSKYDTSKRYPHNVILSDTEKISYLEAPKIELLELVKNKEADGYKFYVDESNGDLMITLDGVLIGSYSIAAGKWSWQSDDNYAESDHNHDERYSLAGHNHDERYAEVSHNHDERYAEVSHNHDDKYADKSHIHDGYAEKGHIHSEYLTELPDHNHDERYSGVSHNHDDEYADKSHNHDTKYAEVGHNHDERYSLASHTHTTINNALTVSGGIGTDGDIRCKQTFQTFCNLQHATRNKLFLYQSDSGALQLVDENQNPKVYYNLYNPSGDHTINGKLTVKDSLVSNPSQTKITSQAVSITGETTISNKLNVGGQLDVNQLIKLGASELSASTADYLICKVNNVNWWSCNNKLNADDPLLMQIYNNLNVNKNLKVTRDCTVSGTLTATSIESNSITANGIDVSTKITQMEAILQNHYQALLQLCQNHGMIDGDTSDGSNITATEGTVSIPSTVEMYQDLHYLRYELALASKVKTLPCFFVLHHHEDADFGRWDVPFTATDSDTIFIYCDFIPENVKGKFTITGTFEDWESKTTLNAGTYTRSITVFTPSLEVQTTIIYNNYLWRVYYEEDYIDVDKDKNPHYLFRPDKAKTGHDYAYIQLSHYGIWTDGVKSWSRPGDNGRAIGTNGAFTLTWEPV